MQKGHHSSHCSHATSSALFIWHNANSTKLCSPVSCVLRGPVWCWCTFCTQTFLIHGLMWYVTNVMCGDLFQLRSFEHPGADPEFPVGGTANTPGRCANLWFCQNFPKKLHEITKNLGLRSATACGLMYYRDTALCGDFLYLSICNVPCDTMCYMAHKRQNMLSYAFNFLQFWGKFGKIVYCPPPRSVGTPTWGKSWIRHWYGTLPQFNFVWFLHMLF